MKYYTWGIETKNSGKRVLKVSKEDKDNIWILEEIKIVNNAIDQHWQCSNDICAKKRYIEPLRELEKHEIVALRIQGLLPSGFYEQD